jgi:pilus assembly protein CpaE
VARAREVFPHLILVDDALGGSDPIPLIRRLSAQVPGAGILALIQAEDISRAGQAVLAGARGFVTKPLQAEDLMATMRQLLGMRRAGGAEPGAEDRPRGRIVVFCSPKGGTGRTTLAINTAVCLQMASWRQVAIVDADFSAPALDVALNLQAERDVADLLGRISRLDEELVSGVLAQHSSGISVLLAPPPGDLEAPLTLPQVQQILVSLQRMFSWVVVDQGLPLNETSFGYLDSADRVMMTFLPEMVGLRNSRLMMEELRARGYPPDKVWMVLNRGTMRAGIPRKDIEDRLQMSVHHVIPDDQPLVTHSINRGVPLVVSHPRSAVARAVDKLAQNLIADLAPEQRQQSKVGLFGRLFSAGRLTLAGARSRRDNLLAPVLSQ